MPTTPSTAGSVAMPNPERLDAAVFAAARAVLEADTAVARAASRADPVVAAHEGREVTADDEGALDFADAEYRSALTTLAACAPVTADGVRSMLEALAKIDGDADWMKMALVHLAQAPALAA